MRSCLNPHGDTFAREIFLAFRWGQISIQEYARSSYRMCAGTDSLQHVARSRAAAVGDDWHRDGLGELLDRFGIIASAGAVAVLVG